MTVRNNENIKIVGNKEYLSIAQAENTCQTQL
jgi:hypothetical protein